MLIVRREMKKKRAADRSQAGIPYTVYSGRDGEGAKLIFIYPLIWYSSTDFVI
jgi:hypothetical protein